MANSPRLTVRLLGTAEADLTEAIAFIAADNPSAALSLADKLEKGLAELGRHPHMGKVPSDPDLIQLGYRYLIIENYLVFYVVEPSSVVIHRILHGARDYRRLL